MNSWGDITDSNRPEPEAAEAQHIAAKLTLRALVLSARVRQHKSVVPGLYGRGSSSPADPCSVWLRELTLIASLLK